MVALAAAAAVVDETPEDFSEVWRTTAPAEDSVTVPDGCSCRTVDPFELANVQSINCP